MNYLGKVAKGVGGVLKAVEGVAVAREDAISMEIDAIVHRISESTLIEDKRMAIDELLNMIQGNPKAQVAVGEKGLSVLCTVLFNMREDVEILRGALEVLLAAFANPENANGEHNQEASAGAINIEIFSQKQENLAVVLSLLEDEPIGVNDFYVRYHAVQLLSCLLDTGIFKLQEAILGNPLGVARLLDLLKEREAIRNEVLLLLAALTKQNNEIQKIAAFEGAFDTLFGILDEEGGAGGSIVVLDCLQVVNNLLHENGQNQRLFRETGFIQKLMDLVKACVGSGPDTSNFGVTESPHAMTGNLKGMLDTIYFIALPPGDGNDASLVENYLANQAALGSCGALTILPEIALLNGGVSDSLVRAAALRCFGYIILANDSHRIQLQEALVDIGGERVSLIQAVLRIALSSIDAEECSAADYLLQSFCWNNPTGQSHLLSSVQPGHPEPTFGSELLGGLVTCAEGSPVGSRTARVLRYLLEGNPQLKEQSLRMAIQVPNDGRQEYLINWCVELLTFSLQSGSNSTIPASLLRLLASWVNSSPPVVQALLEPQHQMSLLVGVMTGGMGLQDQLVTGLTAFLLGECCVAAGQITGDEGSGPTAALQAFTRDLITIKVGAQPFFHALDALPSTPAFLGVVNSHGPYCAQDSNPLDPEFVQQYQYLMPEIYRQVSNSNHPVAEDQTLPSAASQYNNGTPSDTGVMPRETSQEAMHLQNVSPVPEPPVPTHNSWQGSPLPGQVSGVNSYGQPPNQMPETTMQPPPGNPTLDAGVPAPPHIQGPSANGAGLESGEMQALRAELNRLKEDNNILRQELDRSLAGARTADADAAARNAAEVRASNAHAEVSRLQDELREMSEAQHDSKSLISRLQHEASQFASQQERMVSEHQVSYKQLEEYANQLATQVAELEAQNSQVQQSDVGSLEAVREEVERETADTMNDLLICLGLEGEKVNRLTRRLELLGEDVGRILEGVGQVDGSVFDAAAPIQ